MVAALNEEQRGAVEHILGARDYALVVGLPGAGKSATLAATVKALVDMGKSVLVTSHTHNAVDNILARLPDVGIDDFLRVGGDDRGGVVDSGHPQRDSRMRRPPNG